jgi:hypothetical protein
MGKITKVTTDEKSMVLYSFILLRTFSNDRESPETNMARKVKTGLMPISFANKPGCGKNMDSIKMHNMTRVNVYLEAEPFDFKRYQQPLPSYRASWRLLL